MKGNKGTQFILAIIILGLIIGWAITDNNQYIYVAIFAAVMKVDNIISFYLNQKDK